MVDKEILKLAFEAGEKYSGNIEFGEYAETFNDWYENNVVKKSNDIQPVINWQACDFMTGEGMPMEYGKYLICRKDGKIHWETYNGSGWSYNGNVIRYWAIITEPCL